MARRTIASADDPLLDPYRSLKESSPARDAGGFVAEGRRLFDRLLELNWPLESVLVSDHDLEGETAPLLFTAFGSRFFNTSLNEPIASLTVQIYNYALSPYDEWHAQAWAATLVLMTLVLGINIIVRLVTRKRF